MDALQPRSYKVPRWYGLAKPVDPWRLRLERVRGKTGFDGLERISTQRLMDILEVPQRQRTA